MRALENRVPPPVVAVLVAAGMWSLARWFPIARFELPWPMLTGFAVACLGGLVSGAGARERSGSGCLNTELALISGALRV